MTAIRYMFLMVCFFCVPKITDAQTILKSRGEDWNSILTSLNISEFKKVRVVDKEDIEIYKGYGTNSNNGMRIYTNQLKSYENGEIHSFLEGDLNRDGKRDFILACINPDKKVSYLVILNKSGKSFQLIKYFKFEVPIFFLRGIRNNRITISFQEGTDWVRYIFWSEKGYEIEKNPE